MNKIVTRLKEIIAKYNLHKEEKWFTWYYSIKDKRKKLLFYINHRKGRVVFWISHWNTTLLEEYPMLKVYADEVKTSVIKWNIDKEEDIEKKGIEKIIAICVNYHKITKQQ